MITTILYLHRTGGMETNKEKASTTVANSWFPAYVAAGQMESSERQKEFFEHIIGNEYLYYKPINATIDGNCYSFRSYFELYDHLTDNNTVKYFIFNEPDTSKNRRLTCCRGYLADEEDNCLMLLATDSFDGVITLAKFPSK